ncbi:Piso0_005251 [Millerozyma farinosa CBS 7064]|uniref:Piso0_005251 protein n=1 Tax=Pichia sorbitophila (strain ATCC MYA-4447 / BCRC 22081 / CBS 7064 / NBRC 10061 / NRRL Y-12695) TaxID=559304 RepID=G8Y4L7_PICSO|nr:Piso0_005251 [Millerozyma farinosa CBS 7064]
MLPSSFLCYDSPHAPLSRHISQKANQQKTICYTMTSSYATRDSNDCCREGGMLHVDENVQKYHHIRGTAHGGQHMRVSCSHKMGHFESDAGDEHIDQKCSGGYEGRHHCW